MECLLLTGTIKPFVECVNNDPEKRLKQYVTTIKKYIELKIFDAVVFAENSGYNFPKEEISKLAKENNAVFEFIDATSIVDLSKKTSLSIAEATLMDFAMKNSSIITSNKYDCIWKSSGRCFVENCKSIVKGSKNYKNVFLCRQSDAWVESYFFKAQVKVINEILLSEETVEIIRPGCMENGWYRALYKNKVDVKPFKHFPIIKKTNHAYGQQYENSLKNKIRDSVYLHLGRFDMVHEGEKGRNAFINGLISKLSKAVHR